MRVLVLGHTGMLGQALLRRLSQEGIKVLTLPRHALNANDPNFSEIGVLAPDAVVNAIGLINRRIQLQESDFLRVNSIFPRRLADYCQAQNITLIHVSTDCVFSGDAGPYYEPSPRTAKDIYGQTKLWGEPRNALVIRTSIIGPELQNFYSLLCWFLKQTVAVRGFVNHHWNGLTTWELAGVIAKLLRQGEIPYGIRHIHGQDISKFELLQLMAGAYGLDCLIEPFEDEKGRDTRLRTLHTDFLEKLHIAPMQEQLAKLSGLSDKQGRWRELT
jgi:dTDP-4-dehydrorhamnose reductase